MGRNGLKASTASEAEWMPFSVIDFQGTAAIIDTVAGANLSLLKRLFQLLWSSDERLEARVVIELTLQCRDPLAPLSSTCQDALQTASDLELLLRTPDWEEVRTICPNARATALLNLCDQALSKEGLDDHQRERRRRCRDVRPRLKAAVDEESVSASAAIERIAAERQAQCPEYWELLRSYLVQDIADGALRQREP